MSDQSHTLKGKAIGRAAGAFTLIEMLAVIGIIAIIAAFSLPVLKNFGKNDVSVSASRQLLDDVGRARQLAMSQRTTVYMVFLPTNFWNLISSPGTLNSTWWNSLSPSTLTEVTNLMDKQLASYTYLAYGALGDQPGQHQWHYLTPWQSLPDGVYIPMYKFYNPAGSGISYNFTDPADVTNSFSIYALNVTNTFPFPTATNSVNPPFLPYIAFNYLGQLSDYSGNLLTSLNEDQDFVGGGIDIPLVQGSVLPDLDPSTRALKVGSPQVNEMPPGNGTNISFTVVHIDPLTGRPTLEYHKLQ
jgi:prepilin-type N-terminal cleavage/methylation domain-containing protein